MEVTDEWLYMHMKKADAEIMEELESRTDDTYEFSNRFERRMRRLILKEGHPWLGTAYIYTKRAAAICIGIISVIFLFAMSVEAYRIKFFEMVQTIWEDSVEYSYSTDATSGKIQQYQEPGYIPEGYREVDRVSGDTMLDILYENDFGEQITWYQKLILEGGSIVVNSERNNEEIKKINGIVVTFYLYESGFTGAYYEYGDCIYMIDADNLGIEEICIMLESVINAE